MKVIGPQRQNYKSDTPNLVRKYLGSDISNIVSAYCEHPLKLSGTHTQLYFRLVTRDIGSWFFRGVREGHSFIEWIADYERNARQMQKLHFIYGQDWVQGMPDGFL